MAILIAIGGGSGSGKTFITEKLIEELGRDKVSHLSYDYYYRNRTDLTFEERTKVNYDSPDSLDQDLFLSHIKDIKCGKDVDIPQYDFSKHLRKVEPLHLNTKEIVIVDGILIYTIPDFESLFDYTIFVDTDSDIRFARRLLRDTKERGRTPESVFTQYMETVRPMHIKYVEPTKELVNFVFKNNKLDGIDEAIFKSLIDELKKNLNLR